MRSSDAFVSAERARDKVLDRLPPMGKAASCRLSTRKRTRAVHPHPQLASNISPRSSLPSAPASTRKNIPGTIRPSHGPDALTARASTTLTFSASFLFWRHKGEGTRSPPRSRPTPPLTVLHSCITLTLHSPPRRPTRSCVNLHHTTFHAPSQSVGRSI